MTLSRKKPLKRSAFRPKKPDAEKAKAAKSRQRKRARERHERDFGEHAQWVRERGCEVPGCPDPAHGHHEPARKMGGSKEPTAHRLVGLCASHHQDSPEARHKIGLRRFNEMHGTDLIAAAARNWAESPFRTYALE